MSNEKLAISGQWPVVSGQWPVSGGAKEDTVCLDYINSRIIGHCQWQAFGIEAYTIQDT